MNLLERRETPTSLVLAVAADPLGWWTASNFAAAEMVAADLSAKVDVPGYDTWRVELGSDPHTPVIAYATGIDGRGYVRVGPAANAYDLPTVLRHEFVHSLGVLGHSDDPGAVLFPSLAVGEVRDWTAGDDDLLRAGGLIVVEVATAYPPETETPRPPPVPPAPPYTEDRPYSGPLVGVLDPFGAEGWVLVPPSVAVRWAAGRG